MRKTLSEKIDACIAAHRLPESFSNTVTRWYTPLAEDIAQKKPSPLYIGVQGCQGSGKSTLASFLKLLLEEEHSLNTVVLSIDDFYLTRAEREALSKNVHPLLQTRGVPGTHDVQLAENTIEKLRQLKTNEHCKVPRFNKALDDRAPESDWTDVAGPVDVIILEGWCVGIPPQSEDALVSDTNSLEQTQDNQRTWRDYVNNALKNDYQTLFSNFDVFITLQAPSFECVYQWRLLQEEKLITQQSNSPANRTMSPEEIKHFIAHYQRLTEHSFDTLPSSADWVLRLSDDHQIASAHHHEHQKD